MIPIRNKILVHLVNVSFTLLWSSGHLWSSADLNAGNRQVHSRSMGIVDAFIHSLSNRTTITSSFGTTTTILASSQVLPDFPISTARNTEWSESNSETIRPGADGEQQPAVPCRAERSPIARKTTPSSLPSKSAISVHSYRTQFSLKKSYRTQLS